MGFRKGTFEATMYVGEGRGMTTWRIRAGAYFAEGAPGLAVHRLIDPKTGMVREDAGWRISHAGSGSALDTRSFRTRAAALACASALGQLTDWRAGADHIRQNLDLQAEARFIIGAHLREERG